MGKRRKGGAGIGLALVKEIAIHHGWRIKAESSPGIGSSFSLVIKEDLESADELSVDDLAFSKRREVQEQLEAEHFHIVHKSEKIFDKKKDTILLVEDNYDMGILLQNLLGEEYNLYWCSGGGEALAWIKGEPQLSLIICDVMMPNMSGFNFRKQLLNEKDYSKLPFIFLTALADQRDRTEGLASGAVDYIRKPFNPSELLFKIQNLLETNKASYLQAVRDREAAERFSRNTAVIPPKKENPDWQDLGITAAERKIVEYVRIGLQDKEIASELSLSPRTVSSHLSHLYQKTGTQNRVELINLLYK